MNCFHLVKSVLDELYSMFRGGSRRKDDAIRNPTRPSQVESIVEHSVGVSALGDDSTFGKLLKGKW